MTSSNKKKFEVCLFIKLFEQQTPFFVSDENQFFMSQRDCSCTLYFGNTVNYFIIKVSITP